MTGITVNKSGTYVTMRFDSFQVSYYFFDQMTGITFNKKIDICDHEISQLSGKFIIKSYILKDPPLQCEHCQCILTVCHILVECNHLARTRNDIFGRCCVVESFKFHPELILLFF